MTVVNSELEYIKSNWLARMKLAIVSTQVGDDDTTPTPGDTSIGNLIGTAPIETLDESVADQLSWTSKFGITEYIGSTVKEGTLYDGANIRTHDLSVQDLKSADEIHWVSTTAKIKTENGTV